MSRVQKFVMVNPPAGLEGVEFEAMQWSGPQDNSELRSFCDHWMSHYPHPSNGGSSYITTDDGGRNLLPGDWVVRFNKMYPKSGVFEVLSGRWFHDAFKPADLPFLARHKDVDGLWQCVPWDGCAHRANTFIGERYGIEWEYDRVGSSGIRIAIGVDGMAATSANVGDMLVKSESGVVLGYSPTDFDRYFLRVGEKSGQSAGPKAEVSAFAETLRGDLPLCTTKKMDEVRAIGKRLLTLHQQGWISGWEVCQDSGKPGRTFTVKTNYAGLPSVNDGLIALKSEFPDHEFRLDVYGCSSRPNEPKVDDGSFHLSPTAAITVWKDGTWQLWGGMDANYAQADPDFLVNIGPTDLANFQAMERASQKPITGKAKAKSADVKTVTGSATVDPAPITLPRGKSSNFTGPTAEKSNHHKKVDEVIKLQCKTRPPLEPGKLIPLPDWRMDGVWLPIDQFNALKAAAQPGKVDNYLVVELPWLKRSDFYEEVRRLIGEGWEPQGGITVIGSTSTLATLYQAMVRREQPATAVK